MRDIDQELDALADTEATRGPKISERRTWKNILTTDSSSLDRVSLHSSRKRRIQEHPTKYPVLGCPPPSYVLKRSTYRTTISLSGSGIKKWLFRNPVATLHLLIDYDAVDSLPG
jgi:hypothetical protein